MKYCAASFYASENSVTLVFSDSAFTPKQIEEFQASSALPEKNASGKGRTMIHFAFCPGGGTPVPRPAAVKLVEMSVDVADSPFLGFQSTFELPQDNSVVKIERLSGDVKLGGRLAGRHSIHPRPLVHRCRQTHANQLQCRLSAENAVAPCAHAGSRGRVAAGGHGHPTAA